MNLGSRSLSQNSVIWLITQTDEGCTARSNRDSRKHADGTYRLMYTVKLGDSIYVLHAFQKKSTHGIATSPNDINLIKHRL
jgi:hypothetical protein